MKAVNYIVKVLAALAAVVGAVYILATYGEKIVEWCKKVMASLPQCDEECECCCGGECNCDEECECDDCEECECECKACCEETVEEVTAEDVPTEEVPAVEVPAEEPVVEEGEVVAEDTDFEG